MTDPQQVPPSSLKDNPNTASELSSDSSHSNGDANGQTLSQRTASESGNEGSQVTAKLGVLTVGSRIGPYVLVRKLGQGGMGAVYEARHAKLDKTFAIKVLPPGFASNEATLSRFEREMKAVGKLDHPNIIRATNADEWNGTHYLVMEFVEGTDLSHYVREHGPLSVAEACDVIRQAALGLAHAHEHGLVHRDVKPSNLLVVRSSAFRRSDESPSPKGGATNIKLLDLGLARMDHNEASVGGLTTSGQVLGTPDYMAPEQWDVTHGVDARADLYGLGGSLFFALTGRPPYFDEGSKPSLMRLMKSHIEGPIPDLTTRRPDVPPELDTIYRRLMAKNPADRFQTAAEVAQALEPFGTPVAASRPVAPRQDSRTSLDPDRASDPQSTTDASRAPGTPVAERQGYVDAPTTSILKSRPTSRRGRRAWWLVAGALACVVLAVVFSRVGRGTRPTDSEIANSKSQISNSSSSANPQSPTPKPSGWHGWPADAPPPAIAPFNADEARQHQEAWAKYLNVPVEYENSIGMKFRLIPPGEFTMGSTAEEIEEALKEAGDNQFWKACIRSEGPQHRASLTQAIYLGVNEVTQAQYEKVMGTNPSHYAPMGAGKEAVAGMETTNHPVESVSWNDAAEFCAKLSLQEKFKPQYFRTGKVVTPLDGIGYRLPTEAEWEFSCRAGTIIPNWSGDRRSDLLRTDWVQENSGGRTHSVGELAPNPFFIFDLYGNLREWCADEWDVKFYENYDKQSAIDPIGGKNSEGSRVVRGGFFGSVRGQCASAFRDGFYAQNTVGNIGFRVSLTVEAVRQALKVTGPAMPQSVASNSARRGSPDPAASADRRSPADNTTNTKGDLRSKPSAGSGDPRTAQEKLPATFTNSLGMEFVKVPKGTGWLGGGGGKPGEQKVEFTDDFYLGKYEVTQEEWEKVTGLNPSHFSRNGDGKDTVKDIPDAELKRFPVEQVSWDDCQLFVERLNNRWAEPGWSYRLPTEQEWEYACRGGPGDRFDSAFDFYFDNPVKEWKLEQANFAPEFGKGLQRSCRVGSYMPNRLGLCDMHGNLWEWCDDAVKMAVEVSHRVYKGGSWYNRAELGRAAAVRTTLPPSSRNSVGGTLGLRLACVPASLANPAKSMAFQTDAIDFAAERKAAEWVLKVGGSLSLVDAEGKPLAMQGQQLPQTPFAVSFVAFNNPPEFAEDDLKNLAACRRLERLVVNSDQINGSGLRHLGFVTSLGFLGMSCPALTDEGLASLVVLPRLHGLQLHGVTQLTDDALRHIGKLTKLRMLTLSGLSRVTNAGLAHLDDLSELLDFEINRTAGVTDEGLTRFFEHHQKLEVVAIGNRLKGEVRTAKPLAVLPRMRLVGLSPDQLTDEGLATLNSHPRFEQLVIKGPIRDVEVRGVARLTKLKGLVGVQDDADEFTLSRSGVQALATIPELETIHFYDLVPDQFDDACLLDLAAAKKLKSISMGRPKGLTDAGIEAFRKARPDVHLKLGDKDYPATAKSDAGNAPIDFAAERKAAERWLRVGKGTVSLGNKDRQPIGTLKAPLPSEPFCILAVEVYHADLTDDELGALVGCRAIQNLTLIGNTKLTAAALTRLGPQPDLGWLHIEGTDIGDAAVAWLVDSPSLIYLNTFNTKITAAGWESLPPLPRLRELRTSTQVGDAGLRRIVEQCPELRELWLQDHLVTDLSLLARLTRLRFLSAGSHALSEASIETLLKLPVFDELYVDCNGVAGVANFGRLGRLDSTLTHLTLRNQYHQPRFLTSEFWAPVTEMSGLHSLAISGYIAVDGPALRRIAAMPNLHKLDVGDDSADRAKFRTFTPDDIAAFRKARPDVELGISGQTFPALADWPGKFGGSTSIADWTELPPGGPAPAIGTFAPEVAQQRQEEWAKHLGQDVEITNSVGMKFRLIPPIEATVNIGTPEQPRLALRRIATPYYLGTTEVTVGQFKKFVAATGYVTDAERLKIGKNLHIQPDPNITWKTPGYAISDDLPVNVVSPADAQAFCAWLNDREGEAPAEPKQTKTPNANKDGSAGASPSQASPSRKETRRTLYRLPTELEWELACRAGGAGNYGFAGNAQGMLDYAWTQENVVGKPSPVQPVATKRPNPFGLHDVLGNVWEWYSTEHGIAVGVIGSAFDQNSNLPYSRVAGTHWVQPNTGFRVLRQLEPSPPAPKFAEQPVLVPRHTPLGPQANVTRPTPIPGLRSWTIELAGHQSYANSIAWNLKGNLIATTSPDMSVWLWDRDGRLQSILLGHAGGQQNPQGLSFSPDGTRLASVDMSFDLANPSTLRIWDVTGITDRRRGRETSDVGDAMSERSRVRLLGVVPLRRWGWCVAWSPDGRSIAYGGTAGMCEILELATGRIQALNIQGDLGSLAWSPDSRTLCVPENGHPQLFDVASGEKVAELSAPDTKPEEALAGQVAWSPDGRWIAGAHGKHVRIWEAGTRKHLRTIATQLGGVDCVQWHKDGQRLAVSGGGGPVAMQVFDASNGQGVAQSQDLGNIYAHAWSPDGTELVVHRNGLHFLDGQTGKLLRNAPERGRNYVNVYQLTSLSPDGQRFQYKHSDRLEFDVETGQLVERRKSPSGRLLAIANDESWRAYEKNETEIVIEPKRFDRDPVTIKIPGLSLLWRSDPSSERIAQAFDQRVQIWNATTGQPLGTLQHPAKLWSLEWSPDGQQLATIADDKTIRVWDARQHKLTAEFKQFPQELTQGESRFGSPILAWSRDGRSLWIPLGLHAGLLDLSTGRVAPVENFSNGNGIESLTLASDGDRLLAHEGYEWTFLRERDGSRQLLGQYLGLRPQWHPDSRRFLSGADFFGVRGFDVATRRRLGTLWPVLTDKHWLCIGPTGHHRGSEGVEEHIVYVAQLDNGSHVTLSPADFAKRFGWKNDPDKAELLGK